MDILKPLKLLNLDGNLKTGNRGNKILFYTVLVNKQGKYRIILTVLQQLIQLN